MKRFTASIATVGALLTYGAGSAQASSIAEIGISSTTNAGYVVTPSSVRSVSADWTVPTVSCPKADAAVRFAVELADSRSTSYATLGVDVNCRAGVPSYAARFHAQGYGSSKVHGVIPGDKLHTSLTMMVGGIEGAIFDDTAGWGIVLNSAYAVDPTQAGILVSRRFAATGLRPLADFGTLAVTASEVNGKALNRHVERLQMRPPGRGGPQVRVSNLRRQSGAFTATWLH